MEIFGFRLTQGKQKYYLVLYYWHRVRYIAGYQMVQSNLAALIRAALCLFGQCPFIHFSISLRIATIMPIGPMIIRVTMSSDSSIETISAIGMLHPIPSRNS